uniref:Putative secreted protein n=1 Tax=Rhipicephalus microplus TaxID=6941 RepID=A0A6G5A0F9_RHIMP
MHASAKFARVSQLAILVFLACKAFRYTRRGQCNIAIVNEHQRRNRIHFLLARFCWRLPMASPIQPLAVNSVLVLLFRGRKVYKLTKIQQYLHVTC